MEKTMDSTPFRYFLFPHMTLSQRSSRHLSLLVPHLTVLQVLKPPVLPEWGRDHFSSWPTLTEHEHAEQVKLYLKGYQDFGDLHGENSVLASMSHGWIERQARESRSSIQGELRGKREPEADLKEKLLIEAAVFLEMARDLDEKQMDLEVSFRRAETLEEDFREILGIADEEDFEEAVDTLSPPLAADRASLAYMLPRRIAFWLRMFHNRPSEELPVLVALSSEILEELMEPLLAECDRAGKPLKVERIPLASIPSLEDMDSETFEALERDLASSGLLGAYWTSLEDVLRQPRDASSLVRLEASAAALNQYLEARCHTGDVSKQPGAHQLEAHLTLLCTEGCTQRDFWQCIDKTGHREWKDGSLFQPPPSSVLLTLG